MRVQDILLDIVTHLDRLALEAEDKSSDVAAEEGFVQRATDAAVGQLPQSSSVSSFTPRAFGYLKGAGWTSREPNYFGRRWA